MNRKVVLGAIALILVILFGVYRHTHRNSLPSEPEMATILKEASGAAPIPSDETPIRRAIRDSFKYLIDENKSYEGEVSQRFRSKYMANLLHPYSFAVDPYRQGAMTELRSLKELDQQHLAAVQRFPEVAKTNLVSAGVSEADANAFAEGARKGEGGSGGIEDFSRATELELQWIDALLELYQFTDDNRTRIGMHTTDELTFEDENARSQFMALAKKADDVAEQSAKVASTFDTGQRRRVQRMWFTARDASQPK